VKETYEALSASEGGFTRFHRALALVEGESLQAPALVQLQGRLGVPGRRASSVLRAFSWRYAFAELRQSGLVHVGINLLTLWDIHWLFALERWRARHGPFLRKWFEVLAELEALSSLAGFAHVRPAFCYPVVEDGPAKVSATAMGHPLLDAPVTNDVELCGPTTALVVTGSNMSGKSTLLRALGLNAVLSLAGSPVCAGSFGLSPVRVLTSMRVKDSLERGVSYFYAEVQRLKLVLDGARAAEGHALFLLDEVLLGTNARERQIASREVVRLLLETGAIGAVATHDLSLAALTGSGGVSIRNVHLEDQIVDGAMCFDYRLREGVVQGTNALRVLQQAGIEIRE
jgi:DNA mismatch repair ATPase MutS